MGPGGAGAGCEGKGLSARWVLSIVGGTLEGAHPALVPVGPPWGQSPSPPLTTPLRVKLGRQLLGRWRGDLPSGVMLGGELPAEGPLAGWGCRWGGCGLIGKSSFSESRR